MTPAVPTIWEEEDGEEVQDSEKTGGAEEDNNIVLKCLVMAAGIDTERPRLIRQVTTTWL